MKMVKSALFLLLFISVQSFGQDAPDTVRVGIYINSIHDIDFKQKEFTANLALGEI